MLKTKDNYKAYIINGIKMSSIKNILYAKDLKKFDKFMQGQTCGLIGNEVIVYTWDFERFLKGLPVID